MSGKSPTIIGITGGSGSGKTRAVEHIKTKFKKSDVVILSQDSYYMNIPGDRSPIDHDFDHPDAIDWDLLNEHVSELIKGNSISRPVYCFKTHSRLEEVEVVHPANIIIIEGILVLNDPALKDKMTCTIFTDTDSDLRLSRRIERDHKERGRTVDFICKQYNRYTRLAYKKFVEPCRERADMIICNNNENNFVGLDLLAMLINGMIANRAE